MAVEKGRWAIIVKETGEVSDIKRMEGGKPDIRHPELFDVVEVPGDVKIGMVRGADGQFAFPAPERQAEADNEAKDPEGDGDKAADAGGAKTVDAGKKPGKGGKSGGKAADAGAPASDQQPQA